MAIDGLNVMDVVQRAKYMNSVGVDNDGTPVFFDPEKVKKNIDFGYKLRPETPESLGIPPEIREMQLRLIERLIKENGGINPRKDKVYYNPETGELDTWKPGLIADKNVTVIVIHPKNPGLLPPKKKPEKDTKKLIDFLNALTLLGFGGVLGVLLRKPIKNVLVGLLGLGGRVINYINDILKAAVKH